MNKLYPAPHVFIFHDCTIYDVDVDSVILMWLVSIRLLYVNIYIYMYMYTYTYMTFTVLYMSTHSKRVVCG